ncbi:MAG: hypothetical protein Q9213_002052 [Squamulea squamosa]
MASLDIEDSKVLLPSTLTTVTKSLEQFSRKHDEHWPFELQTAKLSISLSTEKVKSWYKKWFGSARIQQLIDAIVKLSELIKKQLSDLETDQANRPRPKWRRALPSIGNKHQNATFEFLYDQSKQLGDMVDDLLIFSDAAFDSLHGLRPIQKTVGSDQLLTSALHLRVGTLGLYRLCSKQTHDCNLEINLRDATGRMEDSEGQPNYPCYRFVTESNSQGIRKTYVESLLAHDVASHTAVTSTSREETEVQLFETSSDHKIIKVPQQGSSVSNYLRIAMHESYRLDVNLTSLGVILEDAQGPAGFPRESLSIRARTELAFRLVESALYLLGTPWLSALDNANIRRLDHTNGSFILRIPTSDLEDLIFDDPAALNKASQLLRLGLLLIEIAIGIEGHPETHEADLDEYYGSLKSRRLDKLPQIEKAMGLQYCKATAFCLQFRTGSFSGPKKYNGKVYQDWEKYLAGFLRIFIPRCIFGKTATHAPRSCGPERLTII